MALHLQYVFQFSDVQGQGFLYEDIFSCLEGLYSHGRVQVVAGADHDRIYGGVIEDGSVIRGGAGLYVGFLSPGPLGTAGGPAIEAIRSVVHVRGGPDNLLQGGQGGSGGGHGGHHHH